MKVSRRSFIRAALAVGVTRASALGAVQGAPQASPPEDRFDSPGWR